MRVSSITNDAPPRQRLLVDIGNQRTKWARVDSATPAASIGRRTTVASFDSSLIDISPPPSAETAWCIEQGAVVEPQEFPTHWPDCLEWHIASVNPRCLQELEHWITSNRPHDSMNRVDWRQIPLQLQVDHPERVGIDRLVAAWGATQLAAQPGPWIVVDSGTAVTVDVVDAHETFWGGLIFPGAEACLRQLSQTAAQLPFLQQQSPQRLLGRNTAEAIWSGVFQLQLGGILGAVAAIQRERGNHQVVATGGGIAALRNELPRSWQVIDDLMLRSLRQLADQHLSKQP